ncbi:MAG: Ig-like domain-containing protein [Myxococcota bacterium]|nr:Ig-like domain-containing protein [Myxococcota bacterium]
MLTFILSSLAWASSVDVFQAQPIVPDGKTQYTVQFRVPNVSAEDEVKIQSLAAIIDSQSIDTDGLVTVKLRARSIQSKETLSLKIVSKDKGVEETVELVLAQENDSKMTIRFDPPRLLPEQRTTVVKVQIDDLAMHQPVLQASSGTLSELNVAGDGLWTALYTVPDDLKEPQAVLFSAIDLTEPDSIVAAATLPIARETSVEVDGLKGAVLRPELRGEKLDDVAIVNGKATITAALFPDDTFARGQVIRNGKKPKSVRLSFDNPAQPVTDIILPVALSNVPKGQTLSYWVVASDAKGGFLRKAERAFIETDGKNPLTPIRPGFFKAKVNIPSVGDTLSLRVSIDGTEDNDTVELISNLPQITAQFEPEDISSSTKLMWSMLAKDGSGAMLTNLEMRAYTNVGQWRGDPESDGDGGYSAELRVPKGTDSIFAYAAPLNLKSQLPAAHVHLIPSLATMPAGHERGVPVFAVVEDALGMPKANVRVNLKVPIGDGVVPAQVTTDESGIAMFMYRAGPGAGPILISAQSGQISNAIRMDQVEAGRVVQRNVVLGSEDNRKSRYRWRSAIPSIYVDPEIDVKSQQVRLSLLEQGKSAVNQQVAPPPPVASVPADPPPPPIEAAPEPVSVNVSQDGPPVILWDEPEESSSDDVGQDTVLELEPKEPSEVLEDTEPAEKNAPDEVKRSPKQTRKPLTRAEPIGPMSGIRVRAFGGYGFYRYQQLVEGGSSAYPADLPFSSGVLGGGTRADAVVLNNKVVLSALASAFPYQATVGSTVSNEALVNMNAAASYRHSFSEKWVLEGGLGYQTGRGILFEYGDTQDEADITRLQIGGVTLNGAVSTKLGDADLQLRLSEMFILAPAQTSAHILFDYPMKDISIGSLILSVDAGMERRTFTVETNGEAIQITDNNLQMLIGLGVQL